MCNRELMSIVQEIKNNDMSHFSKLLEVFGRLIHHFEIKLGTDDGGQELTVFLLELIYSLDTDRFFPDSSQELNKYIAASLRNKYILISKRRQRDTLQSNELSDSIGFCMDFEDSIVLKEGMSRLSERQKETIALRYIYGYSDSEIAERLGITRQAVNRLEKRGLSLLREYYGV